MDKTYKNIIHGEKVIFHDLQPDDYWKTFESLKEEHFLGQHTLNLGIEHFMGGMEVRAQNPILEPNPDKERLCRPTILNTGITYSVPYPTDEQRLIEVRKQLEHWNLEGCKINVYGAR